MHLNGALTVTDIVNSLFGNTIDIGKNGWEIIVCHVLEGEFPKLFIFIRIVFGMISRVLIPSAVSKPNVIPFIRQHECGCFILIVNKPCIRTIKEAMLKDNRFGAFPDGCPFPLYSKHSEDVSVLGNDFVGLDRIVVILAVVHKLKLCLRMRAPQAQHTKGNY